MRIKQFIFTLMVMFACSSFVAVAQDEPGAGSVAVEGSSVFDGEGTEQSPYIIDSSDKLIALRTNVNAGETYAGVYFKLASDIALSSSSLSCAFDMPTDEPRFAGLTISGYPNFCSMLLMIFALSATHSFA